MENQAYYIQMLLVGKLDSCKRNGNTYALEHIKEIQDVYKQDNIEIKEPIVDDKRGQVQEKEVFLYKPYNVESPKARTPEPTFIQDEIENLAKIHEAYAVAC